MDTSNIKNGFEKLLTKYPGFVPFFVSNVLEINPNEPQDTALNYISVFRKQYANIKDSTDKLYKDFDPYLTKIKTGLQFVHHYFPAYPVPKKVTTFIGTFDGFGDGITPDGLIIGLQHHLGSNFMVYKTDRIRDKYPDYVSANFTPDFIDINCIKNIVNDMYPVADDDRPLVNKMIENGKRLYILHKLLPAADENKLINYTQQQLADCYKQEAYIWNMFVKSSMLQSIDKNAVKNYVEEGPKTQELGEDAPGNIGSFAGWQIVKKYMQKNAATTLQQLMALDDETIFQAAKYKP